MTHDPTIQPRARARVRLQGEKDSSSLSNKLLLAARALGILHRLLAIDLVLNLRQRPAPIIPLMQILHVLEGQARRKPRALPRVADLCVQLVDLLEREALGLVDHGPDEEDADEAAAAPDEEDLGAEVGVARPVVDDVRGRVADGEVEQPVAGRGHAERFGAHLEREDLARNDPGHGAPRAREEEDVDAHEGDHGALGGWVLGADDGARDGDDELAHGHADGAEEEEVASAPGFDEVESGEGGGYVDGGGDHGDDEGVVEPGVLEEGGAVVEDEVDAGELLEGLEEASRGQTLAEVAFEAVDVRGFTQR